MILYELSVELGVARSSEKNNKMSFFGPDETTLLNYQFRLKVPGLVIGSIWSYTINLFSHTRKKISLYYCYLLIKGNTLKNRFFTERKFAVLQNGETAFLSSLILISSKKILKYQVQPIRKYLIGSQSHRDS